MRRNDQIRVREVRLIGAEGEQLGIVDRNEALQMARDAGMDLVEVAAAAVPPVCRIMDYGRFKYEAQKKKQEAKKRQTVIQIKEIKLRPKTDDHDYQTKVNHTRRFIEGGDRCKVTVFFRGREIVHKDRGQIMLDRVVEDTKDIGYRQGGTGSARRRPHPAHAAVPPARIAEKGGPGPDCGGRPPDARCARYAR